jgi:hypothetical protein
MVNIPKQLEIALFCFCQNFAGRHLLSGMTKKQRDNKTFWYKKVLLSRFIINFSI